MLSNCMLYFLSGRPQNRHIPLSATGVTLGMPLSGNTSFAVPTVIPLSKILAKTVPSIVAFTLSRIYSSSFNPHFAAILHVPVLVTVTVASENSSKLKHSSALSVPINAVSAFEMRLRRLERDASCFFSSSAARSQAPLRASAEMYAEFIIRKRLQGPLSHLR